MLAIVERTTEGGDVDEYPGGARAHAFGTHGSEQQGKLRQRIFAVAVALPPAALTPIPLGRPGAYGDPFALPRPTSIRETAIPSPTTPRRTSLLRIAPMVSGHRDGHRSFAQPPSGDCGVLEPSHFERKGEGEGRVRWCTFCLPGLGCWRLLHSAAELGWGDVGVDSTRNGISGGATGERPSIEEFRLGVLGKPEPLSPRIHTTCSE